MRQRMASVALRRTENELISILIGGLCSSRAAPGTSSCSRFFLFGVVCSILANCISMRPKNQLNAVFDWRSLADKPPKPPNNANTNSFEPFVPIAAPM